jgi:hypothetical protein
MEASSLSCDTSACSASSAARAADACGSNSTHAATHHADHHWLQAVKSCCQLTAAQQCCTWEAHANRALVLLFANVVEFSTAAALHVARPNLAHLHCRADMQRTAIHTITPRTWALSASTAERSAASLSSNAACRTHEHTEMMLQSATHRSTAKAASTKAAFAAVQSSQYWVYAACS